MLVLACPAFAQNQTTVTGTLTDPNGIAYYPATVLACLSPSTLNPKVGGNSINLNQGSNYCIGPVNTSSSGSFQMALYTNASITPAATTWIFTVQAAGTAPPIGNGTLNFSSAGVTISGTSQDVSTNINSVGLAQFRTPTYTQLFGCQHVNSSQTFAQALAVSGVTCIEIDPGTFPVSTNTTVPTTVGLSFSKGGLLSVSNAVTLTVNSPIYASPDSQIFTYVGTGVAVLGGANSVISNAWFPGADWCSQTLASLTALQSGSNRGGTVDGRHYTTSQTCAANPFAGITMPFQLLVPNANIALNDERAQWLHISSSQQVYGANPALNPGQIYPTTWPEGTLSGTVGVVVTGNVAAVTLTSALPRAPVAGSVWCIAGTSDPIVEGCIQVLASPAPTTTTFSYNAPSVTNRTATGGTTSAAMIAFSSATVQSSFYKNMYLSGNGIADFVFANITGQEQSGVSESSITNYCTNGIFAGGLNTNLGAGPGNNSYTNNVIGTSVACAHSYTHDIWINREQLSRQSIRDTTIVGAGGSVSSGDGILVYNSGLTFHALHIENRASGIRLVGGAGFSILNGSELTCTAGTPCTTAITSDLTGNRISVIEVNNSGTNLISNSFTGTTLTGTGLLYYFANSASPKLESYEVDGTNKVPQTTLQAFTETTLAAGVAGLSVLSATTDDHFLHYNPNNAGNQQVSQVIALTSQYTNSTTGFTNVAGGNTIQFAVAANRNYTATCHLYYQAAATGGLNIEFTGPASPTAVRYGMDLPTALTAVASGEADAFGSSIGAVSTNGAANLDAMVSFSLINGANAGTVNLLAKSSAAVQLQIQSGSYCQIQ